MSITPGDETWGEISPRAPPLGTPWKRTRRASPRGKRTLKIDFGAFVRYNSKDFSNPGIIRTRFASVFLEVVMKKCLSAILLLALSVGLQAADFKVNIRKMTAEGAAGNQRFPVVAENDLGQRYLCLSGRRRLCSFLFLQERHLDRRGTDPREPAIRRLLVQRHRRRQHGDVPLCLRGRRLGLVLRLFPERRLGHDAQDRRPTRSHAGAGRPVQRHDRPRLGDGRERRQGTSPRTSSSGRSRRGPRNSPASRTSPTTSRARPWWTWRSTPRTISGSPIRGRSSRAAAKALQAVLLGRGQVL